MILLNVLRCQSWFIKFEIGWRVGKVVEFDARYENLDKMINFPLWNNDCNCIRR